MAFFQYVVFCVLASLTIIHAADHAATVPSLVLCNTQPKATIERDHCLKAVNSFDTSNGYIRWDSINRITYGTCTVSLTIPSLPVKEKNNKAFLSEAIIAVQRGYDGCSGKPTNATIGLTANPLSVLLNGADGAAS